VLTDPSGHHSLRNFLKSYLEVVTVAAIVAVSVAAPETAPLWGMAIGAGSASAESALTPGNNLSDDLMAADVGAITGGFSGAAGGTAGAYVSAEFGSFPGALAAGAFGGATGSGLGAVMMGADPRTAWRMTYQGAGWGAALAAVFYRIGSDQSISNSAPVSSIESSNVQLVTNLSQASQEIDFFYDRQIVDGETTIGHLYSEDGKIDMVALERTSTKIPSGKYDLIIHNGQRWKNVFEIKNVPGHTGILIQPGNSYEDTTGCIIPGETRSGLNVRSSRLAVQRFMRFVGTRSATITIRDQLIQW
jgi:hypothetical protein